MAKYRLECGTVLDTHKAERRWDEATDWDGRNHISRATGSQWNHETLYRSSKGRFYVVSDSQWQGSTPSAELLTDEQAVAWLSLNGHEIPAGLESCAASVVE